MSSSRCLSSLVLAAGLLPLPAVAADLDGKKIFVDQKCNMCHAVSSAGIEATGKIKAPDLTGLASKLDAKTLTGFLKKETEINGKKHIKPFTGTPEEMAAVVAWLQTQDKKK